MVKTWVLMYRDPFNPSSREEGRRLLASMNMRKRLMVTIDGRPKAFADYDDGKKASVMLLMNDSGVLQTWPDVHCSGDEVGELVESTDCTIGRVEVSRTRDAYLVTVVDQHQERIQVVKTSTERLARGLATGLTHASRLVIGWEPPGRAD